MDARAQIASILSSIGEVMSSGDDALIRRTLEPLFAPEMIVRTPDMALAAQGRDACIQWYVDSAASGERFVTAADPTIEVFDDMAVAKCGGASYMFVLEDGRWMIAWRAPFGNRS